MTETWPGVESELVALAEAVGIEGVWTDGLGRRCSVSRPTLVAVLDALGVGVADGRSAAAELARIRRRRAAHLLGPTLVAWDGRLGAALVSRTGSGPGSAGWLGAPVSAELEAGDGGVDRRDVGSFPDGLEDWKVGWGRWTLRLTRGDGRVEQSLVIAAPVRAFRPEPWTPGWGVHLPLALLQPRLGREIGDLEDLRRLLGWVRDRGGSSVGVLPLLAAWSEAPVEPSPYSPVSRTFWNELYVAVDSDGRGSNPRPRPAGGDVRPAGGHARPDVVNLEAAAASTWAFLDEVATDLRVAQGVRDDPELGWYAWFRAEAARHGRDHRWWPATRGPAAGPRGRRVDGPLPSGSLADPIIRRHVVGQRMMDAQLRELGTPPAGEPAGLALDLPVGCHPDGFDVWRRPRLFASGLAVGAPPDELFHAGQNWGFPPILPERSSEEGHAHLYEVLTFQARVASMLRIDHVMWLDRLYWIPEGADATDGCYVRYPSDELFALVSLVSHEQRCLITAEDLGTVPGGMRAALDRHGMLGCWVAEFAASPEGVQPPGPGQVGSVSTHDTPTFVGWWGGTDIDLFGRLGLYSDAAAEDAARHRRVDQVHGLCRLLGVDPDAEAEVALRALIGWLWRSEVPIVQLGVSDLALSSVPVNVPGTTGEVHANWLERLPVGSEGFDDLPLAGLCTPRGVEADPC